MKKTILSLLVLSGLAMAANVTVTNSITFGGTEHASDRLDFQFDNSTNRTVTITTTSDATIAGSDGYGLGNASNVLVFDITGTLNVTGGFKGAGIKNGNFGTVNALTTMTDDEVATLTNMEAVSRNLLTADFIQGLHPEKLSFTLNSMPTTMQNGGMLAMVKNADTTTYYSMDGVSVDASGYWSVNNGATPVELAANTVYGYITMTAASGAAPKAIGFIATPVPEPATATLSLLALAGLAARRRRH